MTRTLRDARVLVLVPALAAVALWGWFGFRPAWVQREQLARRLEAAGRVPEAWRDRIAAAERARAEAEKTLAEERRRFAAGLKKLHEEAPNPASPLRTKPGALAALNAAVAKSGAKIVSATTGETRTGGEAGVWSVTFLATYREMRETLNVLADVPGVLVRRIDRTASEDAGAKPIWKLVVEM